MMCVLQEKSQNRLTSPLFLRSNIKLFAGSAFLTLGSFDETAQKVISGAFPGAERIRPRPRP